MKKTSKFVSCLLIYCIIIMCIFFCGCSSQISSNKSVKAAFEYFEKQNIEIQFYSIEEKEVSNINIADNKKYFDNGKAYKIILSSNSGGQMRESIYFAGVLDGNNVLYYADYFQFNGSGEFYNLMKREI